MTCFQVKRVRKGNGLKIHKLCNITLKVGNFPMGKWLEFRIAGICKVYGLFCENYTYGSSVDWKFQSGTKLSAKVNGQWKLTVYGYRPEL